MTTLCKRRIDGADKYKTALKNINDNDNNNNSNDSNNNILIETNFCRLLGCINQLKHLSISIIETFDNLTCLINDINDRTYIVNKRIDNITLSLNDVDYKVKTISTYNDSNRIAKTNYIPRNPYNISILIRNTNCKQISEQHYECKAPPKLWLLDNIIGENSDCVSKYSDINFFFSDWLKSELKRQDDNKEKKKLQKRLLRSKNKEALKIEKLVNDEWEYDNEIDEIEYWGEHDDNDYDDEDDDNNNNINDYNDNIDDDDDHEQLETTDKTKIFKTAKNILKAVTLMKGSKGVKEEKNTIDDYNNDTSSVTSVNHTEQKTSPRKNSFFSAFDSISSNNNNNTGGRESITVKKIDPREEEEIKRKIKDVKKYMELDPKELPTFIVPTVPIPIKQKKKKGTKKAKRKDSLNKKISEMTVTPCRKGSLKVEDLVKMVDNHPPSDSPPFSPPSFISNEPPSPPPMSDSPIKSSRNMLFANETHSTHKAFSPLPQSPPPPPPPPPPPAIGPTKLAINSLLSDIKKKQTLRKVSIKEKVDNRALMLNAIKQFSKDVQERNVDNNFEIQTPKKIQPTQNEAISAILANRKLIAGSDSDSDNSDSDFSDN